MDLLFGDKYCLDGLSHFRGPYQTALHDTCLNFSPSVALTFWRHPLRRLQDSLGAFRSCSAITPLPL